MIKYGTRLGFPKPQGWGVHIFKHLLKGYLGCHPSSQCPKVFLFLNLWSGGWI